MNPEYPVYIISKGRHERPLRLTSRALESRHIPYRIVVKPQERDLYASVISSAKILTLPFSNLRQGSIPARNWVWEHSVSEGHARHWILDDNIRNFYLLTRNLKHCTTSGTTFRAVERFADRYDNLALCGMQYELFAPRKSKRPPLSLNTRIYSCLLIDNAIPFRWRGRYNEDTDLSLRALKAGWCTALFNVFLCDKVRSMAMSGGNTDELYQGNGRLEMARSLQRQHPDVTKVVWKWNRWQHQVDYRPFKVNRLRLKPGVIVPQGVDNFGLVCKRREGAIP